MLDKYTWYAIQAKNSDGKMYAWAVRIRNNINLMGYHFGADVISVNACSTKKEAKTIIDDWNKCSKSNGCYMFDGGPF